MAYRWFPLLFLVFGCVDQSKHLSGPNTDELLAGASESIQNWIRDLRSGDSDLQSQAAEALRGEKDPKILALLLAMAQNPGEDGLLRMDVINVLGARKDSDAVKPLMELLELDMRERRGIWAALIPALGEIGDAAATPLLLKALHNREDDWLGRNHAVRALGQIGEPACVVPLVAAASAVDTREDAIAALVQMQTPQAIPVFIQAIDEYEDAAVVENARSGLTQLGELAVSAILEALKETSPEFPNTWHRKELIEILGTLGNPQAIPNLEKLSNDPEHEIRDAAHAAIASIRGENP